MSEKPEQTEYIFTVETGAEFVREYRKLDKAITIADAELEVAKERKHDDAVRTLAGVTCELSQELQDMMATKVVEVLVAEKIAVKDLGGISVILAGRFLSVTVLGAMEGEGWKEE